MAITYELIGQLGASEAKEYPAVFSDGSLKISQLNTVIPVGSDVAVLFLGRHTAAGSNYVTINGEEFRLSGGSSNTDQAWKILRDISQVSITGRGFSSNTEFAAPPDRHHQNRLAPRWWPR